jgi:hypothetical protein
MAARDIVDSDHSLRLKGLAGTIYIFQFLESMQGVPAIVELLPGKITPAPQVAVRSLLLQEWWSHSIDHSEGGNIIQLQIGTQTFACQFRNTAPKFCNLNR